jgi:hypothetical protein
VLCRRLDRSVAVAKVVRLAGWLGRMAVVAVAAFVAVAVVNRLLAPAGTAVGRWPVIAVVFAGVVAAWWWWREGALTRLDVARAIEASHVALGERVSRAVPFLDLREDAPAEPSLTSGLRGLAVADAARAVAAIRRLPVPGLTHHIPWAVAGSVAGLVWLASMQMVPRKLAEAEPRESLSTDTPTVAAEVDHAAAAARLAAAAAVESRLAEILARRFAAAPGQMVDSLSEMQQRDLVTLAGVHEESLRTVHRVRVELAASETLEARAAGRQLESLEDESGDTLRHAITANRLATAAAGVRRWADTLAAVVRLLGGEEGDVAGTPSQLPPREVIQVRRAEAALAAIEQRPLDRHQNAGDGRTAVVAAREAADRKPLPDGAERPTGPTGSEPAGEGTAAPTSEPRFAAGDADISRPIDEAATPQARVWSLLPTASRPSPMSGAAADVAAEYRAAVDLYYQLVLESLASESTGKPAP